MKKSIVCAMTALVALMGIGTYYSVNRIASCEGESRAAACMAEAWDAEKINLLPQYDPNHFVSDPTTDSIFAASLPKR